MKIGVFLQARMESSRLPHKVFLPLENRTMLEHCMAALQNIPADVHAVLTTDSARFFFEEFVRNYEFELFTGNARDVLHRFYHAAIHYNVTHIVRATADNPVVSAYLARLTLNRVTNGDVEYSHFIGNPLGTGVEVFTFEVLKEAYEKATAQYDREHVTPYVISHCETAEHVPVDIQYHMPHCRVTIDTYQDYTFMKQLFADKYTGKPISIEDVVSWCHSNHVDHPSA